MAKQAYVYSGTDWVPLASEVTNLSGYYTKGEIDILDAPTGLKLLVPTSVAVGSGSATIGTAGQVTFSGVSSVQLNGVFTTTYDNYFVYFKVSSMVGTQDDLIGLQFGTSGTVNTASTYRRNLSELLLANNVSTINSTDNQTTLFAGAMNTYGQIVMNIGSPFLSERTWVRANCDTSDRGIQMLSGFFDNTTSFTDLKLTKDAATSMTGTVSVYGYKD
jgi:hypothetical protein